MTQETATGLAPAPNQAPTAIRVGDVFTKARIVFFARWATFSALMAIGYAPIALASGLTLLAAMHPAAVRAPENEGAVIATGVVAVIAFIVAVIALFLAPAAINFGVTQEIAGRRSSFGQCVGAALRRALPVFAASLIIGIYFWLAVLLLIIPGIIVFCMYAVAIPACMAERIGPLKSMSRSAFLTKGNRWRVLGILAMLYIIGGIFEQMVASTLALAVGPLSSVIISFPVDVAVAAFSAVVVGVLYYQLRVAREGVDIEHIAKVFD
jgi:hypothetical protein